MFEVGNAGFSCKWSDGRKKWLRYEPPNEAAGVYPNQKEIKPRCGKFGCKAMHNDCNAIWRYRTGEGHRPRDCMQLIPTGPALFTDSSGPNEYERKLELSSIAVYDYQSDRYYNRPHAGFVTSSEPVQVNF
jgi:hypothetical protein